MVVPRPDRYCPLAERDDLPFEVMRTLGSYAENVRHAQIVRRCLCNSVAHASVPCSPGVCVPKLLAAEAWAKETERPAAALGGAAKKIWREYGSRYEAQRLHEAADLYQLIDDILADDDD